ncbi:hypothetical protein BDV96DRAFT_509612, partial [Lophiotrema nucula]
LVKATRKVNTEKRPRIYFLYLSNHNLSHNKRVRPFSSHGDLTKHLKNIHLHFIVSTGLDYNLCQIRLKHKIHFRAHALQVHGTIT